MASERGAALGGSNVSLTGKGCGKQQPQERGVLCSPGLVCLQDKEGQLLRCLFPCGHSCPLLCVWVKPCSPRKGPCLYQVSLLRESQGGMENEEVAGKQLRRIVI